MRKNKGAFCHSGESPESIVLDPAFAGVTVFILSLFLQADSMPVSVDTITVSENVTALLSAGPKAWVIIKPLQCLGNPWEQDWIARHKKSEVYPPLEEKRIIKDFFAKNQIHILDIRQRPYQGGPLCQTCDCPRGDILYLLVSAQEVPLLKPFGFDATTLTQKRSSALIRITGRVQGVGYRFFAQERALKTQLTGWVRNLPDESVECEVEGPREAIERFIEELKKGPPLSRVDHVEINWTPFAHRFSAFEIHS